MARPPAPTYREALGALQRAYLTLVKITEMPRIPRAVQRELRALMTDLAALMIRDDGRGDD